MDYSTKHYISEVGRIGNYLINEYGYVNAARINQRVAEVKASGNREAAIACLREFHELLIECMDIARVRATN